jgi:hypothetical protein
MSGLAEGVTSRRHSNAGGNRVIRLPTTNQSDRCSAKETPGRSAKRTRQKEFRRVTDNRNRRRGQ